jgi:hypothetical protein
VSSGERDKTGSYPPASGHQENCSKKGELSIMGEAGDGLELLQLIKEEEGGGGDLEEKVRSQRNTTN